MGGGGGGNVDYQAQALTVFDVQAPGSCGSSKAGSGPPVYGAVAKNTPSGASERDKVLLLDPSDQSVHRRYESPSPLPPTSDDPVRDGELVYQHVDVDLPSAGVPFRFERTYRSRVSHWGVLGYGWDFNYNRRLVAVDGCGDVELLTGDSGRIRFNRTGDNTANGVVTVAYAAPLGVPLLLRGTFPAAGVGSKKWELVGKDHLTYEFDARGNLRRVYDETGNFLEFTWAEATQWAALQQNRSAWNAPRAGGETDIDRQMSAFLDADVRWHITKVTDSAHLSRAIYFNYTKSDFFLQCLSYAANCDSPLVSYSFSEELDSRYKKPPLQYFPYHATSTTVAKATQIDPNFGELTQAIQANGVGQSYSYHHDFSQSSPWLPDEVSNSFCAIACGPATECNSLALCTQPAQSCTNALSAYGADHPNVDFQQLCVNSIMSDFGCTLQSPATPPDTAVNPDCAGSAVPRNQQEVDCAQNCIAKTQGWSISEIIPISKSCLPPSWKNLPPGPILTNIGGALPKTCNPDLLWPYCNTLCVAQAVCDKQTTAAAVCGAMAAYYRPAYCGDSCYEDCRSQYQAKDANGAPLHPYGRVDDLNHNLTDVFQVSAPANGKVPTNKKLIQHNEYGIDPFAASFDKVISQQLGDGLLDPTSDNTLTFSYFDLAQPIPKYRPHPPLTNAIHVVSRIPTAATTIAGLTARAVLGPDSLGTFVSETSGVIESLHVTLSSYVDSPASFGSVDVCPSKCIGSKPAPSTPIFHGSIPPVPIVQPHPGLQLGANSASHRSERALLAVSPERLGGQPPGPVPPPGSSTGGDCARWLYFPPTRSTGPAQSQFPANAVVVQDLHGVTRTVYYDARGRLLRDVNHHVVDHGAKEITDYNYDSNTGAVHGVSYANGQRVCQEFDKNGNPAQLTRIPAANPIVDAAPQVTIFNYDVSNDVVDVVVDPDSQIPMKIHYERDNAGRVLSMSTQVDATHSERTSYTYDPLPAQLPKAITHPNGSITVLTEPSTITAPILNPGIINPKVPILKPEVRKPLPDPAGAIATGPYKDEGLATGPVWITQDSLGSEPMTTRITYDSNGRPTHSFRWGHRFGKSAEVDVMGRLLQTGYDAPDGATVTTTYSYQSTSSLPTAVKEPTSTTTYGRNSLDLLRWTAQVGTDGSKRATCWNYGADGRLDAALLPEGNLIENSYDDANRLRTVKRGYPSSLPTWASACVAELTANGLPAPVMPKEPADEQVVTTLDYDDAGFLRTIADGSGTASMHQIVDGFGRIIDEYDDDGNHLRRGYDSRGRVAWEAAYGPSPPAYAKPSAPDGQLQSMVEYQYDNKDRVVRADRWHFVGTQWVNPAKPVVTTITIYDDAHSRVSVSVDGHPATVTEFDGLGRPKYETLPNQNSVTATYRDNGTAGEMVTWTATGPDGQPRTGTNYFDDYGHLLRSDDDLGVTTLTNHYNVFGQIDSRVAASQVSGFGYDSFHRLTSISEGSGKNARSLIYVHDGNDRLSSIIDAADGTTSYFYNGLDLLSHAQHPANGTSLRHYVPGSRRLNDETDQWGTMRSFGYYASGRVRWEHTSNPALLYGSGVDRHFVYSPLGQMTSATIDGNAQNPTNGVTTTLAYDSLGNRILDSVSSAPFSVSNTWDPVGGPLRTTFSFVRSPVITRDFDDVGRLKDVSVNGDLVASFKHETDLGKIVYGLGKVVAQPTFDHRGRKVGVDVSLNGMPIAFVHDALNVDGVVRERQRLRGGQTVTDYYQLDDAGRVVGENLTMNAIPSLSLPAADLTDRDVAPYLSDPAKRSNTFRLYTLDGVANWLSRTEATGTATTQLTSPAGLNQYQVGPDGQSWQYLAGTVSQIGSDVYRADAFGHLATATVGGQSVQYGYDALGRRISEQNLTTGAQTTIIWDGNQPIAIGSGGAFSTYELRVGGDGLDEQVALMPLLGGSPIYLHPDADTSVFAATSDAGLVETYGYSAYGETSFYDASGNPVPNSTIANRFLFQGQLQDAAVGGYSMRAREYLPRAGRFLSPDPLGVSGGENLYAFVFGKPLSLMDPFGLTGIDFQVNDPGIWDKPWGLSKTMWRFSDRAFNPDTPTWKRALMGSVVLFVEPVGGVSDGVRNLLNRAAIGWHRFQRGSYELGNARNWKDRVAASKELVRGAGDMLVSTATLIELGRMGVHVAGPGIDLLPELHADQEGVLKVGPPPGMGPAAARAYSVAYQAVIEAEGAGTRAAHFRAANQVILDDMAANPDLAAMLDELGIKVPVNGNGTPKGLSPADWTWHHDQCSGCMQLVPRPQHTPGSSFWDVMHPGGRGGFSIWGEDF